MATKRVRNQIHTNLDDLENELPRGLMVAKVAEASFG